MTNRQNAAQAVGGGVRATQRLKDECWGAPLRSKASIAAADAWMASAPRGIRISGAASYLSIPSVPVGTEDDFWSRVDKRDDAQWLWTGRTNTNHNTVDCQRYEYGHFDLDGHHSKMAHRIMIYLTYGRELTRDYEVFAYDDNRLNIHPDNLGIRNVATRAEQRASDFFAAANDNRDSGMKVAA